MTSKTVPGRRLDVGCQLTAARKQVPALRRVRYTVTSRRTPGVGLSLPSRTKTPARGPYTQYNADDAARVTTCPRRPRVRTSFN
jgi:hypothetical protein